MRTLQCFRLAAVMLARPALYFQPDFAVTCLHAVSQTPPCLAATATNRDLSHSSEELTSRSPK